MADMRHSITGLVQSDTLLFCKMGKVNHKLQQPQLGNIDAYIDGLIILQCFQ